MGNTLATLTADDTDDQEQRLRPRGSNHVGMRQFNERVVLQAIRLHGSLPKAELARLTHLSAQTVALIMARLMQDDLVIKEGRVRGKIGQPSTPIALNADGAFSIGIKIGRRSLEILLIDFLGRQRQRVSLNYIFPDPDVLFPAIASGILSMHDQLGPALAGRIQGIGIAAPFSLGGWQKLLEIPEAEAHKWEAVDITERVRAITPLPVTLIKDTSAACVAELFAGAGQHIPTFLYIFMDTFIGGGLVIDSHLHMGSKGNAGAIGSSPLGMLNNRTGLPTQLLGVASLINLECLFQAAGLDISAAVDDRALQEPWLTHTQAWLEDAASGIAQTINGAVCLLDLEHVIMDGLFSRALLKALMDATRLAFAQYSWEGIRQPELLAGSIGADARVIGGALLPLYGNFAPDRDLFLKLDS